jgi:phospholipase/carboxylesterase
MNRDFIRLVRKPAEPEERPALIVLLHGIGSHEADLMSLAPEVAPQAHAVTLRAPHSYGPGYAWFQVHWDATGKHIDVEQALESLDRLVPVIEALPEEFGVPRSRFILGGFSQGAMMALGIAMRRPRVAAGIMLLSGSVLPPFVPEGIDSAIQDLPFLVQHGLQDQVLPVDGAREMKEFLEGQGSQVDYFEYSMGHEVSLHSLLDMRSWVQRILAETNAPPG